MKPATAAKTKAPAVAAAAAAAPATGRRGSVKSDAIQQPTRVAVHEEADIDDGGSIVRAEEDEEERDDPRMQARSPVHEEDAEMNGSAADADSSEDHDVAEVAAPAARKRGGTSSSSSSHTAVAVPTAAPAVAAVPHRRASAAVQLPPQQPPYQQQQAPAGVRQHRQSMPSYVLTDAGRQLAASMAAPPPRQQQASSLSSSSASEEHAYDDGVVALRGNNAAGAGLRRRHAPPSAAAVAAAADDSGWVDEELAAAALREQRHRQLQHQQHQQRVAIKRKFDPRTPFSPGEATAAQQPASSGQTRQYYSDSGSAAAGSSSAAAMAGAVPRGPAASLATPGIVGSIFSPTGTGESYLSRKTELEQQAANGWKKTSIPPLTTVMKAVSGFLGLAGLVYAGKFIIKPFFQSPEDTLLEAVLNVLRQKRGEAECAYDPLAAVMDSNAITAALGDLGQKMTSEGSVAAAIAKAAGGYDGYLSTLLQVLHGRLTFDDVTARQYLDKSLTDTQANKWAASANSAIMSWGCWTKLGASRAAAAAVSYLRRSLLELLRLAMAHPLYALALSSLCYIAVLIWQRQREGQVVAQMVDVAGRLLYDVSLGKYEGPRHLTEAQLKEGVLDRIYGPPSVPSRSTDGERLWAHAMVLLAKDGRIKRYEDRVPGLLGGGGHQATMLSWFSPLPPAQIASHGAIASVVGSRPPSAASTPAAAAAPSSASGIGRLLPFFSGSADKRGAGSAQQAAPPLTGPNSIPVFSPRGAQSSGGSGAPGVAVPHPLQPRVSIGAAPAFAPIPTTAGPADYVQFVQQQQHQQGL